MAALSSAEYRAWSLVALAGLAAAYFATSYFRSLAFSSFGLLFPHLLQISQEGGCWIALPACGSSELSFGQYHAAAVGHFFLLLVCCERIVELMFELMFELML